MNIEKINGRPGYAWLRSIAVEISTGCKIPIEQIAFGTTARMKADNYPKVVQEECCCCGEILPPNSPQRTVSVYMSATQKKAILKHFAPRISSILISPDSLVLAIPDGCQEILVTVWFLESDAMVACFVENNGFIVVE